MFLSLLILNYRSHGAQERQQEVFRKGYATRTQWKLGDNSNPAAAYGTTSSTIGARTDPSEMPAAGDRVSGPFKLTGLSAQNKGSNVGRHCCLRAGPAVAHPSIPIKIMITQRSTCGLTDCTAFAACSLETRRPTTFDTDVLST